MNKEHLKNIKKMIKLLKIKIAIENIAVISFLVSISFFLKAFVCYFTSQYLQYLQFDIKCAFVFFILLLNTFIFDNICFIIFAKYYAKLTDREKEILRTGKI